ncbi:MAG: hypothetical protein M1833_002964 [Piccolia ochrophora]|nr:MAG: hypothetical protein M1833_002964 [Piccolia ochrophora]
MAAPAASTGDDTPAVSSSPSSSGDGEQLDPVESLVAGRDKRATAGNRLSTLLDQEADDELELLFAEDEADIEFEEAEADDGSDVQLDSSDDDDDQGPSAERGDEDLEGEKELQKQARAERQAKKRKAKDAFFKPPALRKKVKIDPTTPAEARPSAVPRSKKKSDRVSWMPAAEESQIRSSSRKSTVENKAVIQARLKEHEVRRLSQIAVMDAAAKRKDESKPKELTQADRLAEAARTERVNSKSLNRWEETEKKRVEEQQARLAALHNRKLDGPVITWWSGLAEWVNGKLHRVGRKVKVQTDNDESEREREGPKMEENSQPSASARTTSGDAGTSYSPGSPTKAPLDATTSEQRKHHSPVGSDRPQPVSEVDVQPQVSHPRNDSASASNPPSLAYTSRNLLVLENFDPVAVRNLGVQQTILFKHKLHKAHRTPQEHCVITSQPARFRDPSTGLAYYNSRAYREIQKLKAGSSIWSNLLECYVGPSGMVARGVPERFYWRHNNGPEFREDATAS